MVCQTTFSQKIGLLFDDYISDRWYQDKKYFIDRATELAVKCCLKLPMLTQQHKWCCQKLLDAGVKSFGHSVPTDARKAKNC